MSRTQPTRIVLALGLVLASVACGGDQGDGGQAAAPPPATTAPSPTQAQAQAGPCHPGAAGSPSSARFNAEPAMALTAGATYSAVLATNCGNVTLALAAAQAPHTVNSFVFLAGQKYFDHSPCHRLTTAGIFVLQCGDPTGTGTGGPGYTIPDENLNGATYPAGTVAMANTGRPHTGGSQFFLVYKDTSLPPSYTPFAKVSAGLDVLQQIAAMGTTSGGPDGAPKAGVVIESVTINKA
ncbi:MAG TPA: peptidylprolyl isomerase [Candidatus Dormibacteraeota bacterium]|nr:peptidylprolyl isomerase [Candidatus Dormibacteraeota bacterium]